MQTKFKASWEMPSQLLLGAIVEKEDALFRIFSRHATRVWLIFFDKIEDVEPSAEIELDQNVYHLPAISGWTIFHG